MGDVAVAVGGVALAVVLTNFWNPVGWSAGAVFATTALAAVAYNAATSAIMWCAEDSVVNNNKKCWGM